MTFAIRHCFVTSFPNSECVTQHLSANLWCGHGLQTFQNRFTMAQKEICDYKEKNTKATQDQIAEHSFLQIWSTSIARRTVGDILKRKADWNIAEAHQLKAKRLRTPKFATVEEALYSYVVCQNAGKERHRDGRYPARERKILR